MALGSSSLGGIGLSSLGQTTTTGNSSISDLSSLSNLGIGNAPTGRLLSNGVTQTLLGDDKIRIAKGIFMLAPGVKPAVSRPHTLDTNSSTAVGAVNLLQNLLADHQRLPESKLRQLGSQIVSCPVDHEGLVAIPNGWGGRRLRFMMVFEVQTVAIRYYEILTGYTDFDNPTIGLGGQEEDVDPNMRLFFNNVIRMKPVETTNSLGQRTETLTLMSTHQIMTMRDGDASFDLGGLNRPIPKDLITPTSLFQRMELNAGMNGLGQGMTLDTRTRVGIGGGVTMANRTNTLGSNFFANTFKGVGNAITDMQCSANGGYNMQRKHVYQSAANFTLASETNAIEDRVLARIRENSDYATRGSITYAQFKMIFPEADHICEVIRHADLQESYEYHNNDIFNLKDAGVSNSEEWTSAHFTTGKSQQLLTSIPALMTDCLLSSITFSATNMLTRNFLEPYKIHISAASSYLGDGVDISGLVDLFLREFETRIHPILSDNGEKNYTFTMHCDVLGEMRMTIHYDGLPHSYNYTAGAYCDHLYTPNISGNANTLGNLAKDFDGIFTNIYQL